MMRFETVVTSTLESVAGGQQAAASGDDRTRQIIREEMEDERKMLEKEAFRDWERSHPFSAMLCQGDRKCAGFDRR